MCDDAVLVYGGTVKSVPDCYTHQEMCNKAVDNYPLCYKTQKMCHKAVNTYPSIMKFVRDCLWLRKFVIKQLIAVF